VASRDSRRKARDEVSGPSVTHRLREGKSKEGDEDWQNDRKERKIEEEKENREKSENWK
jgi:hypothetical protein